MQMDYKNIPQNLAVSPNLKIFLNSLERETNDISLGIVKTHT